MKSSLTIAVKKPCTEKFTNFSKTDKGGFCKSCNKEVIDFTKIPDNELIRQLSSNKKNTCGMFKASQLKTYETNSIQLMESSRLSKGIGMIGFSLLALCATQINGQETASIISHVETTHTSKNDVMGLIVPIQNNYTLTGTIVDEANEPLPGVNVILKGTTVGTQTDFDGKFEFPQPLKEDDILVFSYIGYETKTHKVKHNKSSTIDITVSFDTYDVELMGEVVVGGIYSSKKNIFQKFISIFK